MRYRTGFVSNSSSSSFIVSKRNYPTIWDIAKDMLDCRILDCSNDAAEYGKEYNIPEYTQKALDYVKIAKDNDLSAENIKFTTCNFDTFIHDAGETFWISTCNNHPFYEVINTILTEEELKRVKKQCPYSDYNIKDFIELELENYYDFLDIEKQIIKN